MKTEEIDPTNGWCALVGKDCKDLVTGKNGYLYSINGEEDGLHFQVRFTDDTYVTVVGEEPFDKRFLFSAKEMVNHPDHYGGDTTYEVIKVCEAWEMDQDAYLFNTIKCIARCRKKGKILEDLEKAEFYLKRRIEAIKNAN